MSLLRVLAVSLFLTCLSLHVFAQTAAFAIVPRQISYSGVLKDGSGRTLTSITGVTFLIYKDEQGGTPLWLETQSVKPDAGGHYSVQLGAVSAHGIPAEIFASGEGRWLTVQIGTEPEQARVLLVAVPYAIKAVDAETLGGFPASAFVLAGPIGNVPKTATTASANAEAPPPANPNVTGLGTVNFLPLWDSTSDIVNSVVFQSGTGTTAKIGINTITPTSTLDVKGATTVRGALTLPSTGTATATAGKNSQPIKMTASAFGSGTNTAANQVFQWQAEPAGNNTLTPSGTLNLLYGLGTAAPTETGLKINNAGIFTFAPGQPFPGTGNGTITGVTAGTALTGGGTSGAVTLNIDTSKVPLLNAANLFTGNQTVNGNLSATGPVSGSSFQIGSALFAFGTLSTANAFLGFAGNASVTGINNTAVGYGALQVNTTGAANTAVGYWTLPGNTTGADNTATGSGALNLNTTGSSNTATGDTSLQQNTTGSFNTAVGEAALVHNTTGDQNTAIGWAAGPDSSHSGLTNATAIGSLAQVTASNSMVLGSIAGVNGAAFDTLVGIGTTAPTAKLDVHGTANFTGPITFAAGQTFPGTGTITGVNAGTGLTGGGTSGAVTLTNTGVLSLTAGTGITSTGGQTPTLAINTAVVPQLAAANVFTGIQTVNGNLSATGVVTGSSFQIGSNLFDFGNFTGGRAFLGFAGNSTSNALNATGVGVGALKSITSGQSNTAVGSLALGSTTSGVANTAVGTQALTANTQGVNNSAFGQGALGSNVTGGGNTAVGVSALISNTASNNTAVGVSALNSNTSGTPNTAIGYQALFSNTTGVDNTATGYQALYLNQTGNNNTATGLGALYNNTASQNTGVGYAAVGSNTTGSDNSGIGFEALLSNTTGSSNTATGSAALQANTTGASNSAFGHTALADNTFGSGNTAVGDGALFKNTSGLNNTAYGSLALFSNLTGNNLTCLGYNCDVSVDGLFNATGIGNGVILSQSNSVILGGTGSIHVGIGTSTPDNALTVNGNADKPGGGAWSVFSDRRLKDLDGSYTSGLNQVLKINPVKYRYKDNNGMGITDRDEHIGVVAQEVQQAIPEAVTQNSKGYLMVNNDPVIWAMLNAIKEQQKMIREQQGQIRTQQKQIKAQQRQTLRLSGELNVLKIATRTNLAVKVQLPAQPGN